MRTYPKQIVTNQSMTGSSTSPSIEMISYWGGSISCVVTASSSPVGTLTLQGSADGVNFAPLEEGLPGSQLPVTLTVSGDGTYLFDVTSTGMQYLNILYTPVSGTGTLNINVFMKGY